MNKPVSGLGPHGERPAPASALKITEEQAAELNARRYTVAVALHTVGSDWSRQVMAGLAATLGRHSAAITEVADCHFDSVEQSRALERMLMQRPDAIVSIPVDNAAVAEAHSRIEAAGVKLILLDNVPTGLMPGKGYTTMVSADNFGLGQIAAELLAARVPARCTIGLLGYDVDFFATHERQIAFLRWMETHRPDLKVKQSKFESKEKAGVAMEQLIDSTPDLAGCFVAWDEPAVRAMAALNARKLNIPVTTVDLGNDVAAALASGPLVGGIAAQRPYDLGVAAANAALLSLIGSPLPTWIALRGIPVTRENVLEAYQLVWHAPAPLQLRNAVRQRSHS
ncbi:MAG: substrate-binding domain-containing protein [Alphaproteobacteria bacterium]|nr:substrate-binding domain-containing protein [Alphaproteobacteria bacterium]